MTVRPACRDEILDVCSRVGRAYPLISGGLIDRHLPRDDAAWSHAQWALGYLDAKHPEGLDGVFEAFATVSMDFLRLQTRFMRTRRYARARSSELVSDLYANDERMLGYYLDGLAMTYVLWPNHVRVLAFFAEHFLPRIAPGSRVLEVGVGHGLMAAMVLDSRVDVTYVGVDISPASLAYTESALAIVGVAPNRFRMVVADAVAGDLATLSGGPTFDGVICCEVLEHVDEPQVLMSNMAASVRPGGAGFMSTVANIDAEDHVYLFTDVTAIRTAFTTHGWSIEQDRPTPLPGAESWDPLPVNYSGSFTRQPP
ncbi:bifunctional 2-polyprenyl-6-hydroxyphenol methylase/3-demethylubiquinol 3-O-methyltransferase UbiG [Nocardia sp. CNY236]|uniref:class I SAM-dependent methyltransferase n=1 Tax=Nocardia sp. CNY236 TaxID=1169152 RepID=UPI00048C4A52|nr:class I SAM-dependent methyltransferase [Nocardia sp. CNY236]